MIEIFDNVPKPVAPIRQRKYARRSQYEFVCAMTRVEGFESERADCTVRALASAMDIGYAESHAYLKQCGRADRKGFHCWKAYRTAEFKGMRLQQIQCGRRFADMPQTVGQWLKHPDLPARCILNIRGHVIAVVNRVVVDSHRTGSRARVHSLYAVIPAPYWKAGTQSLAIVAGLRWVTA